MPGGKQTVPGRSAPKVMAAPSEVQPTPAVASNPVSIVEKVPEKAVANSSAQLDWGTLLAQLNVQGMAKELAKNCTLESFIDSRMTLNLSPQFKHLQTNKMAHEKLQAALADYFVQPVKLSVTLGTANAATPAAVEQQEKQTRQQQAVDAITQDPFVREAQAQLGALIIEDSVKSIQQENAT